MNRQKFLAELSKLLGFMSSWDKEAELEKYTQMLDAAEDEAAFIEALGTPTQIAINIAKGYKPSPRPGSEAPPVQEAKPEPGPGPEPAHEPEPEPPPPPPPPPKKRDGTQVVSDGEFEYGMELAILMGEPISAAVESALEGKYLPDPDFSLEEILREARGEEAIPELAAPEPALPGQMELTVPETETGKWEPEATGRAPELQPEPEPAEGAEKEEPASEEEPDGAEDADPGEASDTPEPEPEPEPPGKAETPDAEAEPESESEKTGQEAPAGEDKPDAGEKPGEDGPVFGEDTAPLPEEARPEKTGEDTRGEGTDATGAERPALMLDPSKFAELPPDVPAVPVMPDPSAFAELPPDQPAEPDRVLRPGLTAVFAVFMLLIGLPVTLILVLTGVPVLLAGVGAVVLVVYAEMSIIPALSMISDILLVGGVGLAICGVGLLLAWLGLWVSIELGSLWLNAVVLPLGNRMCYKKEAGGE